MSNFQFKQFSIQQDKCAMKVGTDGVLLGAWATLENNPESILDIGAGTGIIALMLAQRSNAGQIDALEIDDDAYEQAVDNFENSPWGDRLFCYHAGLDEFVEEMQDEEYDLIVSNPPFYSEDYTTGNKQRDKARFIDAMPFEELAEAASLLLHSHGIFAVILPYKEEQNFITIANKFSLFPCRITRVKGMPETAIKRSLIAFKKQAAEKPVIDELIIETARHQYTPEYIALTKDFYLKM
ncbi:methyltransferase [Flavobacterium salilacus subsp. salilacus]|uniref:tRNA1(Val) (adenine(37)-N6)-methyltransferase n=1 Tax=Flavobacterium TaxID=237 RepID=UPI001074C113|nr:MULTISPECIES: methyltransferase [Flavobacterium]KAF2520080.1 methyltransferase [Flavobacterium salilacus subsp. salilacus]MBE1614004.1 methyltransferase [Flavobacterium sp. SaA2.13]